MQRSSRAKARAEIVWNVIPGLRSYATHPHLNPLRAGEEEILAQPGLNSVVPIRRDDDGTGCPLIGFEGAYRFRGLDALTHPDPERFLASVATRDGNPA